MTTHLQVDTSAMRQLATDVLRVRAELEEATEYAERNGDCLGHRGLADRIGAFHATWRVHRERLVESLQGLDDAARIIAEAFEKADSDLAAGINGKEDR